ncbi:MAG TPA: ATP-binding cassette domain-containing protein [Gammaproteobacteria bacterium]|jgi:phospholipid/cholesterol/gamma-HCH transport system ATP-binding protein|nr:ATP-binding cassette domain-containing protein [Gammaproteobacteria bacterium]
MNKSEPIIEVKDVSIKLGNDWVHKNLSLSIKKGEIIAIVGGSGSGKTTLLREILMLQRPTSGSIRVFNQEMVNASSKTLLAVQKRLGVLFQQNALFSSLTLLENTSFPLKEHTNLDAKTIRELAALKIMLAGLPIESASKYPSELSGGMQKRAALSRAIVLDPELLFLDEPTAGLDPVSAGGLDELIVNLRNTMGLTVVIVTHDMDTLWTVTDRVAFLGEGKVLCVDTMANLVKNPHPLIQKFFKGERGRTAESIYH